MGDNPFKVSSVKEWTVSLIIAIIIALFIKTFIFNIAIVKGESMYPTLKDGDRLVTNKISTLLNDYERGDIIILKAPYQNGKNYIKRIVGLPGDKVEIINGSVFLNGEILEEDYVEENFTHFYIENKWELRENEVFVMGDNREENASNDSRFFGTVPMTSLKGKIYLRIHPLNTFKKLNR